MTKKSKHSKSYTYPELIEKYFPGDPIAIEQTSEGLETTVTRDAFFDFLKRVSHPVNEPRPRDKGKTKTSE